MDLFSMLEALCNIRGVSGDEAPAAAAALPLLKPLGECSISPLGSLICRIPAKAPGLPRLLLAAHLDQIGFVVTRVTEKGFLKVAPCGGPDCRSLAGARVTVLTDEGELPGVICSVPPHLADGKKGPIKADEAVVDIGLSPEQAAARVHPGDRIAFEGPLTRLLGDRVCGASLDDRAGCAVVIHAAQLLAGQELCELSVALVSQEEVGSAGASTAAHLIDPDFAVAVDVSMGMLPDEIAEQCGAMGGGPMVGFAPALSRRLSRGFCETAERVGIKAQREVMGGVTGTDGDVIAVSRAGVETGLLSVPLRFMHTASEVVSLGDMEATARLIVESVRGRLFC